ncbi:hypothetical protein D7V64_05375 [Acinetobacter cumulans]|uniref:Uncharacterized protein n=1 Tax=Acinetobacter cumulans TaxID=2136182 RepID=A0A3A8GG27_9GAMM|nr:hypothetical protein [Acinetobacter cumulans]RKG54370.1 hypothetical protein D7V64_05375 [Acinetobacter cumulans]
MTHPIKSKLRDTVMKTVQAVPALRQWMDNGAFKPTPVYAKGQYLGLARPKRYSPEGSLAPQPTVRDTHGKRVLLDDILDNHYALIGLNCDPTASLSADAKKILADLNTKSLLIYSYATRPQGLTVRNFNQDLQEVEDIEQAFAQWMKKSASNKDQSIVLLRPDHFVFALVSPEQLNTAVQQLKLQLDIPTQKATQMPKQELLA